LAQAQPCYADAAALILEQTHHRPDFTPAIAVNALADIGIQIHVLCSLLLHFNPQTVCQMTQTITRLFHASADDIIPTLQLAAVILSCHGHCSDVIAHVLRIVICVRQTSTLIVREALNALVCASHFNFFQFWLIACDKLCFLIPIFLQQSDIAVQIVQNISANLMRCDSIILAALAHLAILFALSQNTSIRIGGLYAMADLCFFDDDLNRQWRDDDDLLNIIFDGFKNGVFEERTATMELFGQIFIQNADHFIHRMSPDVLQAIIEILQSGEEESTRIGLQLIIQTLECLWANGNDAAIEFIIAIDHFGIDEAIDTICENCSATAYQFVTTFKQLQARITDDPDYSLLL
jgi:hypothetical protein